MNIKILWEDDSKTEIDQARPHNLFTIYHGKNNEKNLRNTY